MSTEPPDIAKELQDALRRLTRATIILYCVLLALVAFVAWDAKHQRDSIKSVSLDSSQALCAFRSDLASRVANSQKFLVNNPKGIPTLGLTPTLLQANIDGQLRTIHALSTLPCPPPHRTG